LVLIIRGTTMSTPFINPYEVKDAVAVTFNNLNRQTQDLLGFIDGFFTSDPTLNKEIISADGNVELSKSVKIVQNQQSFWDEGVTYHFQPIGERLKEISEEIKATFADSTFAEDYFKENIKNHINLLFDNAIDTSTYKLEGLNSMRIPLSSPPVILPSSDYEALVDTAFAISARPSIPPRAPTNAVSQHPLFASATPITGFIKLMSTSVFNLINKSSDGGTTPDAFDESQFRKARLDVTTTTVDLAKLLDDGDLFFNDDERLDDANTIDVNEAIKDKSTNREYYLIGDARVPIFGKFQNPPITGSVHTQYDFDNKRIDPNHPEWKWDLANFPGTPTTPNIEVTIDDVLVNLSTEYNTPEQVMFGMLAITLAAQDAEPILFSHDDTEQTKLYKTLTANLTTMYKAEKRLEDRAKSYFSVAQAWYDTPPGPARSGLTAPSFPLSRVNGTSGINYGQNSAPLSTYGVVRADESDNFNSLISAATGLSIPTFDVWWEGASPANKEAVIKYYMHSSLNYSITSGFAGDDPQFRTKNPMLYASLKNKNDPSSPYVVNWAEAENGAKTLKFGNILTNMAAANYLRPPVADQFFQLTDLFLESFDITTPRYVKDQRTLIDVLTGNLNIDPNSSIDKILFNNLNEISQNIGIQAQNFLRRGIPAALNSKFSIELFNHTAVRKEDYGLSPIPDQPDSTFLPSYWENRKEQFFPAFYYYDAVNNSYTPPIDDPNEEDMKNNNFDPEANGLPSGFPIMDIRDFDLFFKALKNELGQLALGLDPIPDYPNLADTGLTGTIATYFPDIDQRVLFYDILDKIVDDMEGRANSMKTVPKIPRPDYASIPGEDPNAKFVKEFLQNHINTRDYFSNTPSTAHVAVQILVNTFEGFSKFSQNSAFESIYAAQMFEIDKFNYNIINPYSEGLFGNFLFIKSR
jgi:hypothetical protein